MFLMGYALPEEAQRLPVHRARIAQCWSYPQVSKQRETTYTAGGNLGESLGLASWANSAYAGDRFPDLRFLVFRWIFLEGGLQLRSGSFFVAFLQQRQSQVIPKSRVVRFLSYAGVEDLKSAVAHVFLQIDPTERIGEGENTRLLLLRSLRE